MSRSRQFLDSFWFFSSSDKTQKQSSEASDTTGLIHNHPQRASRRFQPDYRPHGAVREGDTYSLFCVATCEMPSFLWNIPENGNKDAQIFWPWFGSIKIQQRVRRTNFANERDWMSVATNTPNQETYKRADSRCWTPANQLEISFKLTHFWLKPVQRPLIKHHDTKLSLAFIISVILYNRFIVNCKALH